MYALNTDYSDACCSVQVNPFTATAKVWFWTGGEYTFRKVSRRAIAKAIAVDYFTGGLPSVGQWVNKALLA
jgi:hypothetical protein